MTICCCSFGSSPASDGSVTWERRHPRWRSLWYLIPAGMPALAGSLNQRLDLFNDGARVNPVLGHQLLRFAGVRQHGNGQLVDFDALSAYLAGHCVAQAAFPIIGFY